MNNLKLSNYAFQKKFIKGEMAEWFKAHAWKVCVPSKVPWVRIPLSPPDSFLVTKNDLFLFKFKKYKNKFLFGR